MHLFSKTSHKSTRTRRSPLGVLTAATLAALTLPGFAPARAAEPRVALRGSVSAAPRLRSAHLLGRLSADTPLHAALILPLRNQAGLADLLRRQYTPGDPLYHQFLTPDQFTARFSPTEADYAAVAAYARASGLTITHVSAGRTLLSVAAPSAKIESALGVQMNRYRLPGGRAVFASSAVPVLPRSVAARLSGIAGLDNIAQMHPHLRRLPHAPAPITGSGGTGSGPLGGLSPNDIKYAYSLDTITPLYGTTAGTTTTTTTSTAALLDGSGQNIGLFELDGFIAGDVAQYASQFSLPTVLTGAAAPITTVLINGFSGVPVTTDGKTEVTLDIDMILALAPAATGVYVYEADGTTDAAGPATIFDRMVNDQNSSGKPLLSVISCSWGIDEAQEDPTLIQQENTYFQQMAAQGQSLFCSSGDNGAYDAYTVTTTGTTVTTSGLTSPAVDNPASQPYATGVGGTKLSYAKPGVNATTGAVIPGLYAGETVWSAGTPAVSPEGSGGGISSIWAKPSYQIAGASPTRRDVPDVSLNADPNIGYSIFVGSTTATPAGTAEIVGGTSAAAPLWAAYTALINQQRAANGLTTTIGFMNPVLYPYLASANYTAYFHDIVDGDNLFYQAGTGYDDASGLGSFIGAPLLAALSANANQGTGTATISGTVTDSATPPVPIAGATVSAVSAAGTVVASATTDANGVYTLTAPSGIALKLTVTTSAATAPTTEVFTGASISLAALSAASVAAQNFVLTPAHVYPSGIQMISAPYDYAGVGDFAAVFGLTAQQATTTTRLIQYEPGLAAYVFYPTAPADTLRLGQGYWSRLPAAGGYLHLPGATASVTQPFRITLQQGWNQIGDPFFVAAPLSSVTVTSTSGTTGPLASTPAVVQPTLYRWDIAGSQYAALSPASDSLSPYSGYWIYAFQSCTLTIPVPSGAGSAIPPPPV